MSYNSATGIISGSVSHADINSALGDTSYYTNRELCTAPEINKGNKKKPIHHPSNGPLTDSQFKGTEDDITSGIMYGLQVSSNVTILKDLHNATGEYVSRPIGGLDVSPYRLQDFDGYDKNASATLSGYGIYDTAYMDSPHPFGIILTGNVSNNTSGVDVKEMVSGITNAEFEWSDLCLCILIDGYMTALVNGRMSTTNQWAPIYYNGTYCDTFTCPELDPALKTTGDHQVTVVATDAQSASQFQGSGKYVLSDALYSGIYVTIPDLAGKTVEFITGDGSTSKYGTGKGGSVMVSPNNQLIVNFSMETGPTETCDYRIILEFGNLQADVKNFTLEPNGFLQIQSGSISELPVIPMSGDTYTVYAMLYGVGTYGNTLLAIVDTSVTWP